MMGEKHEGSFFKEAGLALYPDNKKEKEDLI
jgi:hypothetical protein